MPTQEPFATAALLAALGVLLAVSALLSNASRRSGLPIALIFLLLGVLVGQGGGQRLGFADYGLAYRLGNAALALILFDGGLNVPRAAFKLCLRPAALLATLGVVGTSALVALAAHLAGLPWLEAFLVGAIVSSTDAAAVFAALRSTGVQLRRRVAATLEVESGLNDPTAAILVLALTAHLAHGKPLGWGLAASALWQIGSGGALGYVIGRLAAWLLRRVHLPAAGLYPVFTLAVALLSFGLPTLVGGSGFLAVYVAGHEIGNRGVRYRSGLLRVHDAAAWLAQVLMFLVLGLLADPADLLRELAPGLAIGLFLVLVARPLSTAACLAPFQYRPREVLYVGLVGLRGAVPIIFATFPVLENVSGAFRIFDLVFFVVLLNALVPGAVVPWLTRKLGLISRAAPLPSASLELASTQLLEGEVVTFYISNASAACGAQLSDLPFPEHAAAMVLLRGTQLIAPRGHVKLEAGDHLYIVCTREDLPLLELIFGQTEEE